MKKKDYLTELKKTITLCKIEEKDPYYYLYEYIKKTQRDLKILLLIDEVIIKKIETKRKYLEESLKSNLNGEIISFDSFPVIGPMIKKIVKEQLIEYETLKRIEGNEKIESAQNLPSKNIVKLETRIYKQILEEIKGIEKKYSKTDESIPRDKQIAELKEKIEKNCAKVLNSVSVDKEKLVEDGKINTEVFKKMYAALDDETIKIVHTLTKIETEKTNIYSDIKNTFEVLENIEDIFNSLILEIVNEKIEKTDEVLPTILFDSKYKREKELLIKYNALVKNKINLGTELLDYMDKFDPAIYEILNIRCRLLKLHEKIKDMSSINNLENNIPQSERENLKKTIKEQINNISLGKTDVNDVIMILKDVLNKFQEIKEQQLMQTRNNLAQKKEIETTLLILLAEKNNIQNLYTPVCKNITTPLEAIYIYNTLMKINESGKNMQDYRSLIEFISDKNIHILKPEVENIINQIINEQFDQYFEEVKKEVGDSEEPKRLIHRGE